jgi:hypothetical protein
VDRRLSVSVPSDPAEADSDDGAERALIISHHDDLGHEAGEDDDDDDSGREDSA